MGVRKHFVKEKSANKQVELGQKSNFEGLAADPKHPIKHPKLQTAQNSDFSYHGALLP
jgi:hypothetical protein